MKKLIAGIAASCLAAVANVAGATTTTYVYTAPSYATGFANSPYKTSDSIGGNFTTAAPLPPNLTNASIGPGGLGLVASWAFSDGVQSFTDQTSRVFSGPAKFAVSTDANGAITAYDIAFVNPAGTQTAGQKVNWLGISTGSATALHGNTCQSVGNSGVCDSVALDGAEAKSAHGSFAIAPATYVFTSQNYAAQSGPYTTSMHIAGYLTTSAPLPANLSDAAIGPGGLDLATTWSFNDGLQTFTQADSQLMAADPKNFAVSTDATGTITSFHIALQNPSSATRVGQSINAVLIANGIHGASHGVTCQVVVNGACLGVDSQISGAVGAFVTAPPPKTQTSYFYSSPVYDTVLAPYTAAMNLSGTFTTAAPLAANLANAPIGPGTSNPVTGWSFNDGVRTFTDANSQLAGGNPLNFSVSTDANGAIVRARITLENPRAATRNVGDAVNEMLISSVAQESVSCSIVTGGGCVSGGISALGSAGIFVTIPAVPPIAPAVPAAPPTATTTAATAITATSATLNGMVNDNGADASVIFDYGTTPSYGSDVLATVVAAGSGSTTVSKILTGLTCNTAYHFRVDASNVIALVKGNDATFTTTACSGTGGTTVSAPMLSWPSLGVAALLLLVLAFRSARRRI